jgi:hypothetical protein
MAARFRQPSAFFQNQRLIKRPVCVAANLVP